MRWFKDLFSCNKLNTIQKDEYDLEQGIKTVYNMRFASIVILVIVFIFGILDSIIISDGLVYRELNKFRILFILLFFIPSSAYFIINKKNIPQYLLVINAVGYGLFLLGLSYIAKDSQQALFHNSIGLFMLNVVVYILFGLKRKYAILVSIFLLFIINSNCNKIVNVDSSVINRVDIIIWFVIVTIVALLLNMNIESANKKNFIINYQLKDANQSRYKLFNIVSHDLKNIISAQTTITDFLQSTHEKISEKERNNLLGLLNKSSNDALAMFEDLMIWIKSQMDIIKPIVSIINFDSFMTTQVEQFALLAENKNISIDVENIDLEGIQTDSTILSLVFRNILGNAIKYSKNGSHIKVQGKRQPTGFQLQVVDSGIGISNSKLNELFTFDKLLSTHGTDGEKGTGMGLVLTKDLLTHIEGTIKIESCEGVGTTVMIDIPEVNSILN